MSRRSPTADSSPRIPPRFSRPRRRRVRRKGKGLKAAGINLFSGQPSGYVSRWMPGKGEAELPGTRAGYPNGVLVSADGRYMYFNAWTAKEVHKYDLKARQGNRPGQARLHARQHLLDQ